MTTIYDAADQRVVEQDGSVLLAPVKADAGQPFAWRVDWRGTSVTGQP